MSRVDDVVDILGRSGRGKRLDATERLAIARAVDAALTPSGRVRGLEAVEVLCERPEHFEGSGRFSAIFRAQLKLERLSAAQRGEMLVDLLVHDQFRKAGGTIADYGSVRKGKQKEVAARAAEVDRELERRLRRIGFWKEKKRCYEGVVLIGIHPISEHQRGKPRRELRQEFLYGIEHESLLTILLGAVANGHLVQFEEYWGYRDWKSLTREERARAVLDAARGVQYLHELNVIHRDVKPENVLLKGRKRARAKLCDYGLIDSDDLAEHGVTKTEDGTVVGTILYMAPEQARGATSKSSDVFSLGGLLYAYLTERHPTPIPYGATRHQQSDQVLHRRRKPQDPLELLRGLDRAEEALVRRLSLVIAGCLREDPAERYPDVSDLVADLEAVLDGQEPGALIAHVKRLRAPLDFYRDGIFSPTAPFPDEEHLEADLVSDHGSTDGDEGSRAPRPLLRGALLALATLLVAGLLLVQVNPRGYGDQLVAALRSLGAQVWAWVERLS